MDRKFMLLCEFMCVNVNTWTPPPRRISYLMFPFQLSVLLLLLLWPPPPLVCLASLSLCVCVSACVFFQYRFISSNLHNGTMLPKCVYAFSYVKLAFCLWVRRIITATNLWKEPSFNPYPTAFPYGNGMVLHFHQQQESSTTKTVHKVIN